MAAIVATIIVATGAGISAELRYGGRAGAAARRALLFVLYLVLPPATFFNLVPVHFDADIGAGVGIAYLALTAAALAAWLVAVRLLHLSRPATGSVLCCTLVANTGYLGYPLVAALLGFDRLSEAVVYDVLVSGPALLLGAFSVGAAFGELAGEGVRERIVAFLTRNPPLYAPALLFLLAAPLIDLPGPYLLLAAMPCGINTMIVTHAYGLDLRISAGAVAWTTAIAVAAIVPIS